MKNARFWAYVNGGPVKITLRPGQSLSHSVGGLTDEGWFRESTAWEHVGDGVIRQWESDGADCDGRLTRGGCHCCPLASLRNGDEPYTADDNPETWDGVRWPAWQDRQEGDGTARNWYAKPGSGGQALVSDEGSGANIAVVYDEKDAPLIAAAPELLEALRAIHQGFVDGSIKWAKKRWSDSDPYHPANTLMSAALAKAEGY